jgi:Putative DNA-binding domain
MEYETWSEVVGANMAYTPFEKSLDESLSEEDLQVLITNAVAEGYYIEYKRQMLEPKKIGKSIAAFANTYGGWHIVGVHTDAHNVATQVNGFSLADCRDPIATLRDSIRQHINPVPVFYPQVVSLRTGTVVLVVYVPGEQDTPFITSDGRVYRRVSDRSDPMYENDRYALDRLVEQGRKHMDRFARFCRDPRTFAPSGEEKSWVNVFLSPYPSGLIEKWDILSMAGLEKLLQRSRESLDLFPTAGKKALGAGNIPFDIAQVTSQSVILRQVTPSRATFNSLAIELFVDGRARFFLPLSKKNIFEAGFISNALQSKKAKEALQRLLQDPSGTVYPLEYAHFFDISPLWTSILVLLNFYLDWLGNDRLLATEVRTALRCSGVWRTIPFVDKDEWGDYIEKFGLPVMLTDEMTVPETLEQGRIVPLEDAESSLWVALLLMVGMVFGLPGELLVPLITTLL